jgi:hypothetical protein
MGLIELPETSVTNSQSALRNIQEKRRPLSDHVERPKANIELSFNFVHCWQRRGQKSLRNE